MGPELRSRMARWKVLAGLSDLKYPRNIAFVSPWCGRGRGLKITVQKGIMVPLLLSLLLLVMCVPQRVVGKVGSDEKDSSSVGESVEMGEDDQDLEMAEYLDDEVRFVTEDDFLYEEDRSHYRDFQGVRGASNRINHQYERCPPLPDPSAVESSGLCEAKKCQRDDECSTDGSVICCYNGCISSCTPKVNLPLAFDWVEETDLKYISKDQEGALADGRNGGFGPSPRTLLNAELSPETIALPGGCFLNPKQYEDLIMFRKFEHIKSCSCSKGEVSCEINHEEAALKG